MSQTTIRQGYCLGSGPFLDTVTSVTVEDCRIRGLFASNASGTFYITGTSTDAYGTRLGSIIRFALTTNQDEEQITLPDNGMRFVGPVYVSAPASAAQTAIWYG